MVADLQPRRSGICLLVWFGLFFVYEDDLYGVRAQVSQ